MIQINDNLFDYIKEVKLNVNKKIAQAFRYASGDLDLNRKVPYFCINSKSCKSKSNNPNSTNARNNNEIN